jgi:hypothetical protein
MPTSLRSQALRRRLLLLLLLLPLRNQPKLKDRLTAAVHQ